AYNHPSTEETKEIHESRSVSWWFYDDGKSFSLGAFLPAETGRLVALTLESLASKLPGDPDTSADLTIEQRRADALVGLCSQAMAGSDGDGGCATVVVHAGLDALLAGRGGCTIEGGGVLHPEVGRELICDGRLQVVLEAEDGHAVGISSESRTVPRRLRRQVLHRDHGCTFPGCGTRSFIDVHHITPWPKGATELSNLTALCNFHHKLVHRHGWRVELGVAGETDWFRPDGTRFTPGPSPPKAYRLR
ncbi:MAG: DUF222 domain-containing protein, partial [Actinomycetota bacterium]